jgi:hypothetical protein
MNDKLKKPRFEWWEYVVYVLVTIPLLVIGAVLWLFGIILRLTVLIKRRR